MMSLSPDLLESHVGGPVETSRASRPLTDILTMIRQRLWLIVLAGLACALLATAASMVMRPTYKATAQLLVDPRDLKLLENQVTPTADAQNIGVTLVESQVLVLGSDNVLRRVIQKLALEAEPEFNGTQPGVLAPLTTAVQTVLSQFHRPEKEPNDTMSVVLDKLQRMIKIRRIDRTYVIELSATAQSRDIARRVLDAVIDAYMEDQSVSRADVARRAGEDIDGGIDQLRRAVDGWERKVETYRAQNNLVGARGLMVIEQQLSDINTQLITARVETARLKARLDATPKAASDYDKVPEAVASQPLRDLRASLARISQQKAAMATQMLPNHPAMRGVTDNERQVLSLIGAELARIRRSITIEYQRAQANEKALDGQLAELRTAMNSSATAQIQLRELDRELEASRAIYRQAINRGREAREQIRLNTANVRVISAASADLGRTFPPPLAFLAGFGFLIGTMLTLLVLHVRRLTTKPETC